MSTYKNARVQTTYDSAAPPVSSSNRSKRESARDNRQAMNGSHFNAIKPSGGVTFSRRGLFFSVTGVIVIVAWVFFLGVLVGRGTIFENKIFKQVEKSLPVVEHDNTPHKIQIESETGVTLISPEEAEKKLTFYDTVKKEPEKVPETPLPPVKPAPDPVIEPDAPGDKKPEKISKKQDVKQAETAAVKKLENPTGVRTVTPEQSAAPPPQRKKGENFTVQVEAVGTAAEAEQAVKRLQKKGFDAYYYQVTHKGRKYFRIRVGRYESREEAQETYDKLTAMGRRNMFISQLTD